MDFDLFENDIENEILSSVLFEPTQVPAVNLISNILPEFQCSGEDSSNAQFSTEGFVKNCFLGRSSDLQNTNVINELTLSSYDFNGRTLHGRNALEFIFGEACKDIQYLTASVRGSVSSSGELSNYRRRQHVTHLLHLLYNTTYSTQWIFIRRHLEKLQNLLNRITDPDMWKQIYFANNSKGNECNLPAYHLLHGFLEWKLLDMCILQKYDTCDTMNVDGFDRTKNSTVLISQLERIIEDLLTCSIYVFAKKRSADLLYSSPFPCTCFKELWLLLQIAVEKWFINEEFSFWSLCNKALTKLKMKMDYFSLNSLTYCVFCNWLINALVRLFGYRTNGNYDGQSCGRATNPTAENFEFSENCTQQFLHLNPNEEYLRIFISQLTPTLLQWWSPKSNIPIMFWEHFHKHLNSSFYVAGTEPSNLAIACSSGKTYLDKYQILLKKEQPDGNLSSYTLFTILTGKTLERLLCAHLSSQADKFLGRIYAKFSLQKFLALNETGIHHLLELFIIISLCGDFNELGPKLREKLLSISFEKVALNRQVAVAKGHMALLILHAKHRLDLSEYITKILKQLSNIRNEILVSKIVADGLLDIFTHSDDFRRGEHLLIDAWLPNFLNNCTPAEQDRILEALHLIFSRFQGFELFGGANEKLLKSLNTFILPYLKQQYVTNFSQWIPQLAADFCVHAYPVTDIQNFQKLFQYFTETQTANRQAVAQFLLKILETDKGSKIEPTVIMQVWLKNLVLLTTVNEEVISLTKAVVQLEEFQFMSDLDSFELLKAKEPLCTFIAAVGKKYDNCTDYKKRCKISDNFNGYVRNFEKWIPADFKNEKTELLFRFYSFIAIVIYNCPHIIYTKSKITCFFHIAITRFILPTSLQIGKNPEGKLAHLVHKIWPVLVQGMGRLHFKSDSYLTKTLIDLIHKWTPNFKISPNSKVVARPFISCLQSDNNVLSLFVFEKLTSLFLTTQRRQADPNACLVIIIFREIVDAVENEQHLETFMKGTCLQTLEHIMMVDDVVPSRNLLIEFYRRLTSCAIYETTSVLKKLLAENLRIITKKHLAYNTFFYFDLLMKFVQISHELVEEIFDFLMEEVHVVEKKRGAGEDNRIRGCVQQLRQNLAAIKQKNNE